MFSRSESLKELVRRMGEESRQRREEFLEWRAESRQRHEEFLEWRAESHQRHEEFLEWRAESRQLHEETRAAFAENRTALEEFREFNREILLRNEKVYTSVIARLEELGAETRANTARTHESTEETRAHTQAMLRVLDWIDKSGGAATA